jgi:hypothetical protein
MLRIVALNILLFLLPFTVYAVYLWISRRRISGDIFNTMPLSRLVVAGLVLAIAGFLIFGAMKKAGTDAVFVPAYVEDEILVPGHFIQPEAEPVAVGNQLIGPQ